MKDLLIMRHAKSSHDDNSLSDFERPLNPRGFKTAPLMGDWIASNALSPQLVISSSARRAHQTAELAIPRFPDRPEWRQSKQLYLAPPQSYLAVLCEDAEDFDSVLMVGHNPGIEQLIYNLSTRLAPMPTAAVAWFQFDIEEWTEIPMFEMSTLQNIWRPKEISLDG